MKLSTIMYALGFLSIAVSATNMLSGKRRTGEEGEHNALFIGEWPPTFFILGKVLEDRERALQRASSTSTSTSATGLTAPEDLAVSVTSALGDQSATR
ncbi:hypothetical protein [Deinococcus pimensis]|uniref:hypothetical protein n=1 Tax=Deinococcus pimensis TaxID=309888 RepID=UPI0004AC56EE|nr:hypothetical protein [Deinococcus pimensis]